MNRLPVVFICDKQFVMPTTVAITSLIANRAQDTSLLIYIICADCEKEETAVFHTFEQETEVEVRLIEASVSSLRDVQQISSITAAGLLKFSIADMIPDQDKILFIDGDMIIREDLYPLYRDYDVSGYYFAAVLHSHCILSGDRKINSGLMLINLKKMRDEHMSEKLLSFRRELGDRRSMDQQSLNLVCEGHILFLPPRYNCMPKRFEIEQKPQYYTMDEYNAFYGTHYRSWQEAVRDAAVIHYITGEKPWKYRDIYGADEWYRYYLQSPYKDKSLDRGGAAKRFQRIRQTEGLRGVTEYYLKRPLRYLYYQAGGLKFRKRKWAQDTWG